MINVNDFKSLNILGCFQNGNSPGNRVYSSIYPNSAYAKVNDELTCQAWCQSAKECKYFVFNMNSGECEMKSAKAVDNVQPSDNHIFGSKYCQN